MPSPRKKWRPKRMSLPRISIAYYFIYCWNVQGGNGACVCILVQVCMGTLMVVAMEQHRTSKYIYIHRSNIKRDIRYGGTTSETATSGSIVRRPFGGNLTRTFIRLFLGYTQRNAHKLQNNIHPHSKKLTKSTIYCIEPIERIHYSVTNPNNVQYARCSFRSKKV